MAFLVSINFNQATTKRPVTQEKEENPAFKLVNAIQTTFNEVHQGNLGNSRSEISVLGEITNTISESKKGGTKELQNEINEIKKTFDEASKRLMQANLDHHMRIPKELEYKAKRSSLDKLSTFVQSNLSLIHAAKQMRETNSVEYKRVVSTIQSEFGSDTANIVHQLSHLNLEENKSEAVLDVDDFEIINPEPKEEKTDKKLRGLFSDHYLKSASHDIEDDFMIMDSGSKEEKTDTKLRGLISEHYLDTPTRTRYEIAGTVRDFFHTTAVFNAIDDSMLG